MLVLAAFVLLQAASEDALRDLIEQLGSDRIEARGEALRKLEKLGRAAVPALTKAAADRDVEISSRARSLLDRSELADLAGELRCLGRGDLLPHQAEQVGREPCVHGQTQHGV